jgi:hypothetical protein
MSMVGKETKKKIQDIENEIVVIKAEAYAKVKKCIHDHR